MASIGGVTVSYLYGEIPAFKQTVAISTRSGLDGFSAVKQGSRGEQFGLRISHYAADEAAANTFLAAIQALQGDLVTIVDAFAVSTSNVLIEAISQPQKQAVIDVDGNTRWIQMALTCRRSE